MITDVGIDIDGVLYDFASAFKAYAENRMGHELPSAKRWDFYKDWGLSDDEFQDWLHDATVNHRIFDQLDATDEVIDGWHDLKDAGIKIHVLTHRHPEAYGQTITWLMNNNLIPDSLHFGENKEILRTISSKSSAAIDDYYGYYEQYTKAGIMAFMCDQPWNRQHAGRRVADLLDFANVVILINDAEKATKVKPAPEPIKKPKPLYKTGNDWNTYKKTETFNPHDNISVYTQYYMNPPLDPYDGWFKKK